MIKMVGIALRGRQNEYYQVKGLVSKAIVLNSSFHLVFYRRYIVQFELFKLTVATVKPSTIETGKKVPSWSSRYGFSIELT